MPLAESSSIYGASSRKILGVCLRALANRGQTHVADAMGKSETWVSRWKQDDLQVFAEVLAVLHLKVVPVTAKCYSPEYIDHLHYFAKRGMESARPELEQDWEE